jgi:hypothetical protein
MNSLKRESSHCINTCEINTTTSTTTTSNNNNNNVIHLSIQSHTTQFYTCVVFIMYTLIWRDKQVYTLPIRTCSRFYMHDEILIWITPVWLTRTTERRELRWERERERVMELVMVSLPFPMELPLHNLCRHNPLTVHAHTVYTRVNIGIIFHTLITHSIIETTCIGLLQNWGLIYGYSVQDLMIL